jgi:hypothetical protein
MTRSWIAVASAEHVRIGRSNGFMQVCHGKGGPLRRISPGDRVAYYSPTESFGGKDRLQAITAVGVVRPGVPYQADMGDGFRPFRRDVDWHEASEVPIRPLPAASPSRARPIGAISSASACSRSRMTTWS